MKNSNQLLALSFATFTLVTLAGCTQGQAVKSATTDAIVGEVHDSTSFGELVCYEGAVCKKVELLSVLEENGQVSLRLRNRSTKALALQVSLEWVGEDGAIVDTTRFHDVPMAPRQVGKLALHGPSRNADHVRIVLRDRRAL